MNFQNRSNYQIMILTKCQIIPNSRPGLSLRPNYPQFETWVVTPAKSSPIRDLSSHSGQIIPSLRLGWSSKPSHLQFETWVVTQAKSFPIWDLGGHPSQIVPNMFGFEDPNHWITQFETWMVIQAKLSPNWNLKQVSNPQIFTESSEEFPRQIKILFYYGTHLDPKSK